MQNNIRTFVAIKIIAEKKLLDQLNNFKVIFEGERINWVNENNLHLTLRFLGNTTQNQLSKLVDLFDNMARLHQSFELEIKGAGYFKTKGNPSVLFVKIIESSRLKMLVKSVEENVVSAGFHEELKPFRPHVTLGRIKHLESRTRFYGLVDELKDIRYQKINVTAFILYQSILTPEGPIYKAIKTYKMQ